MVDINKNLDDLLDLPPTQIEDDLNTIDVTGKSDADFARENIREMILKGNKLLDELSNIAIQSEIPQAFDVSARLIQNLSGLNKDLMEIQKRKKDLLTMNKGNSANATIIGDKAAVFIGSTAELLKTIKENK
jgi:GTPase SAR1 family protein